MSDTKLLNSKGLIPRYFLCLGAVSLFVYIIFHIYYLLSGSDAAVTLFYIQSYTSKAFIFILPPVCAIISLVIYAYVGTRRAILCAFILSLSVMVYAFPYYYIVLIEEDFASSSLLMTLTVSLIADGINTPLGLALSLCFSLAEALLTFLRVLILLGVAVLVSRIMAKKRGISESWSLTQAGLEEGAAFDLSSVGARLVFSIATVQFLFQLISTVISTASFFSEVGLSYTAGELVTVIVDYLFIIALFAFTQYGATLIKNRLLFARLDK